MSEANGEPRRAGWPKRIAIGIAATAFGYVFLSTMLSTATTPVSQFEGTGSSSFATDRGGLAAYAELLRRYGVDVEQQRGPIDIAIPFDATLFVIDPPSLDFADRSTLREHVLGGGRLVVGGPEPDYLGDLRAAPPTWTRATHDRWDPRPLLDTEQPVVTANEGEWSDPGPAEVIVGTNSSALLLIERVGDGDIVYLADSGPLTNDLIDTSANAAFALALVDDRTTAVFAEGVHGYDTASGWRAIPSRWKTALGGLLVAGLLYAWSRGARFGPVEHPSREFDPPRAEYVEALGATLVRADARRSRSPRIRSRRPTPADHDFNHGHSHDSDHDSTDDSEFIATDERS